MTSGVRFVFSPALYPRSTIENKMVFAHGKLMELKTRNGEISLRVKDEKGEWEGFIEERNAPVLSENMNVRAYGIISAQPDGRNVLACKWIRMIDELEKEFCVRQTSIEWERLTQEHAGLNELKPFVRPEPKLVKTEIKTVKPAENTPNEFISAAEINVEREYL